MLLLGSQWCDVCPKTLGEADIISVSDIISETPSFAEGKHHSKNALLSTDKSAFFVGAEDGNRTRIFSLGSWCSATELLPRKQRYYSSTSLHQNQGEFTRFVSMCALLRLPTATRQWRVRTPRLPAAFYPTFRLFVPRQHGKVVPRKTRPANA